MSREMGDARRALYYLEVPPFLFGRIAQGISAAGRADGARGLNLKSGTEESTAYGSQSEEERSSGLYCASRPRIGE